LTFLYFKTIPDTNNCIAFFPAHSVTVYVIVYTTCAFNYLHRHARFHCTLVGRYTWNLRRCLCIWLEWDTRRCSAHTRRYLSR